MAGKCHLWRRALDGSGDTKIEQNLCWLKRFDDSTLKASQFYKYTVDLVRSLMLRSRFHGG